MLLQHYPTIAESIVLVLSKYAKLTVEEIHEKVDQHFVPCTLRAIYKQISNLKEQGVVFKLKNHYSLHMSWIVNLTNFAESLYKKRFETLKVAVEFPQENELREWSFSDLSKLDKLWTHLALQLDKLAKGQNYYIWHPHPWFCLNNIEDEISFQHAANTQGRTDYMIIGGNTYLDRDYVRYLTEATIYSFSKSSFRSLRARHYSLHGDYIITVVLNKSLAKRIDRFFLKVKSKKDLQFADVKKLLTEGVKAKLILENNPTKAKKLAKKFKVFFGV